MPDPAAVEFCCAVCGGFASRVRLFSTAPPGNGDGPGAMNGGEHGGPRPARIQGPQVWTESPVISIQSALDVTRVPEVAAAIQAAQAGALLAVDREFVPFYCGDCQLTYCHQHWHRRDEFEEGFFDAAWGRCPKGHQRMLWD